MDVQRGKRRSARAADPIFVADRAWSHVAESHWMKRIEDAFQALADIVCQTPSVAFDASEEETISEFYSLWQARAERRALPYQYIKLNGIAGAAIHHDAATIEQLEKNGYLVGRPDGSLAMRDVNAASISLRMGSLRAALEGVGWGVLQAIDGEFCIPDKPVHGFVPLTPSICIAKKTETGRITRETLGTINCAMQEYAVDYIFARSLDACPGVILPLGL